MSNKSPFLIDAHTHVQFAAFSDDWGAVIDRAFARGVWAVNVGTQKDTSQRAITVAEAYSEGVYATVGLHPIHTVKSYHDEKELGAATSEVQGFESRGEEFDYGYYKTLAEHPKVVAIGECGLDYYRLGEETTKKQEKVFIEHIRLSSEAKKPLMIHCRKAFGGLISILNAHKSDLPEARGIIHFFSGSREDAQKFLDLGFSFSFGGVLTFVRDYDDVVRFIPLDRIVLETDAPYVAPAPHRGKRNEPVFVWLVAKALAEIKKIAVDDVAISTTGNARRIFGLTKNAAREAA